MLNLAPSNSAVGKRFYHYHCVRLSLSISCRPCSHYSDEIWKGKSHSENSTNVFLSILRCKNLNAKTITSHFIFVLAETSGGESHVYRNVIVPFSKRFPSTLSRHFQILKMRIMSRA